MGMNELMNSVYRQSRIGKTKGGSVKAIIFIDTKPPNNVLALVDHCPLSSDTVLCWQPTLRGTVASQSCLVHRGTPIGGQVTRACDANATWSDYSDYSQCIKDLFKHDTTAPHVSPGVHSIKNVFLVGYSVSVISLVVSLSIFVFFKKLRCLRNTIHSNLIMSFLLRNISWIVLVATAESFKVIDSSVHKNVCLGLHYVQNYATMSNFCWMFVEGLHLHTVIVFPFNACMVNLKLYLFLGWGLPLVVVNIWAGFAYTDVNGVCHATDTNDTYDLMYKIPIVVLLLGNTALMLSILKVVCTKLRSLEQPAIPTQYSKALRSMFILFPLLGVNYVLLITPISSGSHALKVFITCNAVMQSTQGLIVSILYCFCNSEVTNVIRSKWAQWIYKRDIGSTRSSLTSAATISMKHRNSSIDLVPMIAQRI